MSKFIWKMRYSLYMHKHGASWPTCWYCAKFAVTNYKDENPIEMAKEEMSYWEYG